MVFVCPCACAVGLVNLLAWSEASPAAHCSVIRPPAAPNLNAALGRSVVSKCGVNGFLLGPTRSGSSRGASHEICISSG